MLAIDTVGLGPHFENPNLTDNFKYNGGNLSYRDIDRTTQEHSHLDQHRDFKDPIKKVMPEVMVEG